MSPSPWPAPPPQPPKTSPFIQLLIHLLACGISWWDMFTIMGSILGGNYFRLRGIDGFGIWEAMREMERLDRERARTWEARSLAAAHFLTFFLPATEAELLGEAANLPKTPKTYTYLKYRSLHLRLFCSVTWWHSTHRVSLSSTLVTTWILNVLTAVLVSAGEGCFAAGWEKKGGGAGDVTHHQPRHLANPPPFVFTLATHCSESHWHVCSDLPLLYNILSQSACIVLYDIYMKISSLHFRNLIGWCGRRKKDS